MDQKNEGTPNPLNPNMGAIPPDANPSEPAPAPKPARPATPARAGARPTPSRVAPARVATAQPNSAPAQQMGVVTNMDGSAAEPETTDPLNRPMQKAAPAEAPKPKKKTGLIIGMIVSLFVAVGCGVAAFLLFANSQYDAVALAMGKIINGEAPENVNIDGTIDIDVVDLTSPISDMKIMLKSEAVTKSMINSSVATISTNLRNGGSFTLEFDEVYAANGDLYFRLDGIANILEDPYILGEDDPDGMKDAIMETLAVLDVIDGQWIRVSLDELNAMTSGDGTDESSLSCMVNLVNEAGGNSNSFTEMYGRNPFITSTTENLSVVSEKDPIYKVTIDEKAFRNFIGEAQNTEMASGLSACMGYEDSAISADELLEDWYNFPEFYVEIDGNNDFTRFYFASDENAEDVKIAVDLRFSYPKNVNVPEPTDYKDLQDVMQELTQSLYEGQALVEGEVETVEVTE